jgi:GT2 family glycosyltransferase
VKTKATNSSTFDISVIIVNWNSADYTMNCLTNLAETDRFCSNNKINLEIIIIDSGSTDNSIDYLAKLSYITLVPLSANVGFARSCSIGVSLATGRYILLLNPDIEISYNNLLLQREVSEDFTTKTRRHKGRACHVSLLGAFVPLW